MTIKDRPLWYVVTAAAGGMLFGNAVCGAVGAAVMLVVYFIILWRANPDGREYQ